MVEVLLVVMHKVQVSGCAWHASQLGHCCCGAEGTLWFCEWRVFGVGAFSTQQAGVGADNAHPAMQEPWHSVGAQGCHQITEGCACMHFMAICGGLFAVFSCSWCAGSCLDIWL